MPSKSLFFLQQVCDLSWEFPNQPAEHFNLVGSGRTPGSLDRAIDAAKQRASEHNIPLVERPRLIFVLDQMDDYFRHRLLVRPDKDNFWIDLISRVNSPNGGSVLFGIRDDALHFLDVASVLDSRIKSHTFRLDPPCQHD